jgi:Tol biopolymer transport system component/predicted Ser/Thr protein kinase
MRLDAGTRLGPYEIIAHIGAGGMGDVYKARDTRLDRIVAVKICAEQFSERFEREARAVAALNHPNICALYDVGPNYLVMEYIEGPTLAGPIPLAEALPIARQIAEALEAAHEKGFIHRDLKPANIKLTNDGKVKVLDFGLAKAFDTEPRNPSSDPANSPTLTISATRAGMILGTAGYMSPEQARGVPVDKRADIWAYGVVLYEMLTGREMFSGETVSDALAAVLKTEVDWSALPPETPAPIRRLLRRCLERDRKKRLRDIGDALVEIDEAGAPVEQAAAPAAAPRARALPWAVAAVFAVVAAAVSLLHFRESPPEPRLMKFFVQPPEKSRFDTLVISPDGRRLAFTAIESGKIQLWVRPLDSLTAQPLAGVDRLSYLFWSPDSRFIAFFAEGKLKKIEASGGPPQTLCDAPNGRAGSWNRDGVILFNGSGLPLSIVPAEGGEAKPVTAPDAQSLENLRYPTFLPDGHHYLYSTSAGIFAGALESKDTTRLQGDTSNAAYAPTVSGAGYLLFWRGGSLMAQPFDPAKLRLSGGPFPVAEEVGYNSNYYLASFSVSENGVLVYDSGGVQNDQLVWLDRTGKPLGTVGEPGRLRVPSLSPDDKQVAVSRFDPKARNYDLWIIELGRGISTRFTFDPKDDSNPVWSPDGRNIAFSSNREGVSNLYRKRSSGAGKDELLLKSGNNNFPTDWSPDGRFLLYTAPNPKTKGDLWVLPDPGGTPGDKKPVPFLQTEFIEALGVFSPDGKWVAYQSDESGTFEIYVQTFPSTGAKWQVSKSGGTNAKWRRDGKELFYLSADGKMTVVEVKTSATFQRGSPQPLFEVRGTDFFGRYAVTRDGQRFLITTPVGEAGPTPTTVVINWMAGIKR